MSVDLDTDTDMEVKEKEKEHANEQDLMENHDDEEVIDENKEAC